MHELLAAGWAGEVLQRFHFHGTRPLVGLALHQHDVGGADAHDVEDAQRSSCSGAGVTCGFQQGDAAVLVACAFALQFLIMPSFLGVLAPVAQMQSLVEPGDLVQRPRLGFVCFNGEPLPFVSVFRSRATLPSSAAEPVFSHGESQFCVASIDVRCGF
jgi:hypothetical protein